MDELGKSAPATEDNAEPRSTSHHPNEFCLNCGTRLLSTYCHECGQKDIPQRQTLSELFINFISSFWSYEGKFLQTTKFLFFKPGFLAAEYNRGRRESYFHPARMYVFTSFLFFLLFFSLPETERPLVKLSVSEDDGQPSDSTLSKSDSLKQKNQPGKENYNWNILGADRPYTTIEQYESAQRATPPGDRDGWMRRILERRSIEIGLKYKGDVNRFVRDFRAAFSDSFSKVLFYLMPFFALVLKLLYLRRNYFYSEHLVLTIYYYNFFFLAGCFVMLVNLVPWLSWLLFLLNLWIVLYFLFAMKRMYQEGWGKTILKFLLFAVLFAVFAVAGTSINAIAIILTI